MGHRFGATLSKKSLLLSSALIGFGAVVSGGAMGQPASKQTLSEPSAPLQAAPRTGTRTGSTPAATRDGNPADAKSGKIEEVVVTAEKRSSTAQRTPAALTVVGATQLQTQHVVQFRDLNSVLPDVQVLPVANSLQVAIRGIGSNFIDPRADPATSVSVNGLYFTRALPGGFSFLDVARVESLDGPQGTLYGRNAAAGAVNIITNQPSTDRISGLLQGTYGSYDENDVTAVLNVPLSDTLAVRGAYERDRRNGYLGDYFNDNQSDTGRIAVKWTPTDNLRIYAESDITELGGHGNTAEGFPCPGTTPFSTFLPASCSAFRVALRTPQSGHTSTFLDSDQVHVDYDLGFATLTSISGYVGNHLMYSRLPNGPYFLVNQNNVNDDFSEEIRLTGNDTATHQGGIAWQIGTYLFDSTGTYYAKSSINPVATQFTSVPQHSEAGFAQVTYGVTDRLRATGGIRYTNDVKGVAGPGVNLKVEGNRINYKLGVEYDLQPGKLIYANTSTGYVAGGADGGNNRLPTAPDIAPTTFRPETITAYEIGSKNRLLNDRLLLNGDFYYYNFHNYQLAEPSFVNTGQEAINIVNGGGVTTYGFETQATIAATPVDRLSASVTYAEGTFGALSFPYAVLTRRGYQPEIASLAPGERLVNLPKWVAVLGYEHSFSFDNGSALVFDVNSKLSTSYALVAGSISPIDNQKDYSMTDISVAYHFPRNRWVLRVFANNLENAAVATYGQAPLLHNYGVLPPRIAGVTLTANF